MAELTQTQENTETPAAAPEATETTTAQETAEAPKNLMDGDETPGAENTETPADTETKGPKNLLGDEPEEKDQPEAAADTPPTEEAVKAWTDGIKAIDLGDGVKFDDPLLSAMTPELMKMSGGDPKKAEGVVKAFTAYRQGVVKKLAERDAAIDSANITACEKEFGPDIRKVIALAKEGGRIAFGEELWNVVRQERKVCNNPRFIRQMAWIAKRFSTDTGRVVPKDGTGGEERGDVLHRMYGGVKV